MKNSSKNEKITARVLLTRILAGILAALLMASAVFTLLAFILDTQAEEMSELDSYAFSDEYTEGDYRVAVALRWTYNAGSAYGVVSPFGFAFGEADIQRNLRSFTPVWLSDEKEVVVASDRNMKYYGDSLAPTESEADTDIGGYNVELCFSADYIAWVESALANTETLPGPAETTAEPVASSAEEPVSSSAADSTAISTETEQTSSAPEETSADPEPADPYYSGLTTEIWDTVTEMSKLFSLKYDHVFPAYINGEHKLRIGAFADYDEAAAAAAYIGAQLEGYTVSVVPPSADGIMILNGALDTVLFEYSGEGSCCGGICARQKADSDRYYLCLSANSYLYDGVFCFRRYESSQYSNLTLINLVSLLEYCEGVLPPEIGNWWPVETMKAFAVAVNSYTISNHNLNYTHLGCDLVASSENQNYWGRQGVNAKIISACEGVEGTILTYTNANGKTTVANCAYSSSQGGYTVAPQYVWGGTVGDYLCSQPTMWENYRNLSYGFWTYEVTPQELANLVKKYNSSLISGSYITDVSYETAPGSTYVYSLSLTDNKGKTATVVNSSKVSSLMGNKCASANFVIGKDTVSYTWDEVLSTSVIDLTSNYSGNLSVKTSDSIFNTSASLLNFITRLGQADKDDSAAMYVRTSSGIAVLASEYDIPMTTLPGADGIYTYVSDYGDFLIVNTLKQHNETLTASNTGSFVVAGKGWGHGVGMSQWGAKQLGDAGALYHQILAAYYPGTELCTVEDYLN